MLLRGRSRRIPTVYVRFPSRHRGHQFAGLGQGSCARKKQPRVVAMSGDRPEKPESTGTAMQAGTRSVYLRVGGNGLPGWIELTTRNRAEISPMPIMSICSAAVASASALSNWGNPLDVIGNCP